MEQQKIRPNAYRLYRLADLVAQNEHYDQGSFASECGTPHCIAGSEVARTLESNEMMNGGTVWMTILETSKVWKGDQIGYVHESRRRPTVEIESIADRAARQLGLTAEQAAVLFDSRPARIWPEDYRYRWMAASSLSGRDRMIVQRSIAVDFLRDMAENADNERPLWVGDPAYAVLTDEHDEEEPEDSQDSYISDEEEEEEVGATV